MAYRDNPREAAKFFGAEDRGSYLAHSIRKIEREILRKYDKHYHILTHVPLKRDRAASLFSNECCIIFLPSESDGRDEKSIRLALGHELGHLVYKFEDLTNSKTLDNDNPTDEEEGFAWAFAYCLIDMKSKQHDNNDRIKKFIYKDGGLERSLSKAIKDINPKIHNYVFGVLGIPEPA